MFGRKMTIKKRQEIIISEIFQACYDEWRDGLGDDLMEIMHDIVAHKHQKTMEDLFGEKFVKLAHLFVDALSKKLGFWASDTTFKGEILVLKRNFWLTVSTKS